MSDVQSKSSPRVFVDLSLEELIDYAIERKEGILAANGALSVATGKRTGRSPKDKFIVAEPKSEKNIDWDSVNQALSEDRFHALWQRAERYAKSVIFFI